MHSSASSTASKESVLSPSAHALDNQNDIFISIEELLSKLDGRLAKKICMRMHESACTSKATSAVHASDSEAAGHIKEHGYKSYVF